MSTTSPSRIGTPDNSTQILNDIQSLQDIEQQLFTNLEENQNLSPEQQKQIIHKINDISNMRINLYQTLNNVNNIFENTLSDSRGTLYEQTSAIGIVEKELNNSKAKLQLLEEEKNNKIRLIEINNYFGEKYAEHSKLMKIVVCILFPILILAILNKKGFLSNKIYYFLVVIVAIIGSIFFWKTLFSIWYRDSMNYQEYDWYFNPNTAPANTTTNTTDPWAVTGNIGTCIGDACCTDGMIWDASLNQCAIYSASATSSDTTTSGTTSATTSDTTTTTSDGFRNYTKESFINDVLSKPAYQHKYKKQDVYLGSENVQPVHSSSFIQFGKF